MLKIIPESHVDHVRTEHLLLIQGRFAGRAGFGIETIEIPEGMPSLWCGLYGPVVGDEPVDERDVRYRNRDGRPNPSRTVDRPERLTRIMTVVFGPYQDHPCVLFTAYGGPAAPKEPLDPRLTDAERAESKRFWAQHALASVKPQATADL